MAVVSDDRRGADASSRNAPAPARQGGALTALAEALEHAQQRAKAAETKCAQLEEAVVSRDLIGQAKGILMERHRVTADAAFALLRNSSQAHNIKLRDVAAHLARTGELPKSSVDAAIRSVSGAEGGSLHPPAGTPAQRSRRREPPAGSA